MKFKIRANAIGQIMTNARKKTEMLSQTAKTYCETWLKEQLFNRRKEIDNKYLTKGVEVEDGAIDFVIENTSLPFAMKNEKHFEKEFVKGTPDLILSDKVIDIKSSWDIFTFPLFEKDINKAYWWQLQGYMYLTGKEKAELTYVLIDTPIDLIEKEIGYKSKDKEFLTSSEFSKFEAEFYHNMTFSDIEAKHRIKTFSFNIDNTAIDQIKTRVAECQVYINELLSKINESKLITQK